MLIILFSSSLAGILTTIIMAFAANEPKMLIGTIGFLIMLIGLVVIYGEPVEESFEEKIEIPIDSASYKLGVEYGKREAYNEIFGLDSITYEIK